MAIYLKEFSTTAEYEEYISSSGAILPNVSICDDTNDTHYNPYVEPPHDYSQDYFTMVAKGSGGIVFNGITSGTSANTLQYSTDGGSTWSTASSSITVSVTSGQKVMFKGMCTPYQEHPNRGIGRFTGTTASFDAEGNPMSLLFGDGFKGETSLEGKSYAFYGLFSGCTSLVSAENLLLPATTLANNCYESMFLGCTNLETAPQLPATTLTGGCYAQMFSGCTSLETAPELPATTAAYWCYESMFSNCSSLEVAPELPATTLANNCYAQMFLKCTSLTKAPTLPATTLTDYCYMNMFNGCTNLSSITCLATDISARQCTAYWLGGVSSTGTFAKASTMTSWPTGYNGIPSGWTVTDYSSVQYFTIVAKNSGDIVFNGTTDETSVNTLQYSIDGGTNWSTASSSITVSVNSGDAVMFKGTCTPYIGDGIGTFSGTTADFDVDGNPMSLLYGDDFKGQTSLSGKKCAFYNLFNGCTTLQNAESLSLPATTLEERCYDSMFASCTSLTTAPTTLPAMTLARQCYSQMFYECSGLTTAPSLPATTLEKRCYGSMFASCTSLTTAPELPATTLAEECYSQMFYECSGLTTAPSLPATTLAEYCYDKMLYGCSSLTTAPELPATTLAGHCYDKMFYGCSSLTTAPSLPATTLADWCYFQMFMGCTNLSSITCLATDISAYNCTYQWVNGVAASGTFTKAASMTSWTSGIGGVSGIPTGWTVVDAQ